MEKKAAIARSDMAMEALTSWLKFARSQRRVVKKSVETTAVLNGGSHLPLSVTQRWGL